MRGELRSDDEPEPNADAFIHVDECLGVGHAVGPDQEPAAGFLVFWSSQPLRGRSSQHLIGVLAFGNGDRNEVNGCVDAVAHRLGQGVREDRRARQLLPVAAEWGRREQRRTRMGLLQDCGPGARREMLRLVEEHQVEQIGRDTFDAWITTAQRIRGADHNVNPTPALPVGLCRPA